MLPTFDVVSITAHDRGYNNFTEPNQGIRLSVLSDGEDVHGDQVSEDLRPCALSNARLLLEVLTPIVKSWPSEWCLEAISLAIQIHGGYGYTRDFPVEHYWRDNRLNVIHEGTHGIHALDLLGRKVRMKAGAGLALFSKRVRETLCWASYEPSLAEDMRALSVALDAHCKATDEAWETADSEDALANATLYLLAFGHVTVAWIWLAIAVCVLNAASEELSEGKRHLRKGLHQAARHFFDYELPKTQAWLMVVSERNSVGRLMRAEWF